MDTPFPPVPMTVETPFVAIKLSADTNLPNGGGGGVDPRGPHAFFL
jgi:hypothetical protein